MFLSSGNTVSADDRRLISGQDVQSGSGAKPGTVITVTLYDNDSELLGIY